VGIWVVAVAIVPVLMAAVVAGAMAVVTTETVLL